MLSETDRDMIKKIMETADKLLHETRRLRADVVKLHGRIEPFENEVKVLDAFRQSPTPKNLKSAIEVIAQARENTHDCERMLAVLRSRMDEIASDAISRSEMKPWLRERGNK